MRGPGNGFGVDHHDVDDDDDAPSDHREGEARTEEESFDRSFAALAEEMERELNMEMSPSPAPARRAHFVSGQDVDRSLETNMNASTVGLEEMQDASSFRAASRAAKGAFIEKFAGEAAARLAEDDNRVASASPVFDPARAARARRLMRLDADQGSAGDDSHGCSDGGGDETRRSGGFRHVPAGADDAVAWARWGGGRGITIVETDAPGPISASADPPRSRRGGVGAPLDEFRDAPRDGEDILEAWRRRRRREAMEKGDQASAAARAAAALAALEGEVSAGDDASGTRPDATGRVERAATVDTDVAVRVPIDARSRFPAETSGRPSPPVAAAAHTSPVGKNEKNEKNEKAARASSVASRRDADGVGPGAATPSRARRSL